MGCKWTVSPVVSPNPHGAKTILIRIIKMDINMRDLSLAIFFNLKLFVWNIFLFFFSYACERKLSSTCPCPTALCALSLLAETKHGGRGGKTNLCPTVHDYPCMCVVNHQQYNGSECQMCPCYIINDSGKHKVCMGFPQQRPISKIFCISVALLINYIC